MSKPKKVISVRFDEQLREIINQEAQKKGIKPSEYIRGKLKDGLKEHEIPPITSHEHIEMPVKESEEDPTEEDFAKRLENKLKELETRIAGVSKLPEVKEPEVEKAEIALSDDEIDRLIRDAIKSEKKEESESYMCSGCGYIDNKEFNPCPKCGNKLKW